MPRYSPIKITKSAVDQLKPGETIFDSQLSGFGVRSGKSKKSYIVKTQLNGKQKLITIGAHGVFTPDQARTEAIQILANAKRGIDPTADKKGKTDIPTLEAFSARYMQEHAIPHKKASSVRMDAANIKNHIIPLLGQKLVSQVNYSDIEQLKHDVANGKTAPKNPKEKIKKQGGGSAVTGGRGVANRVLALLHKIFNLALRHNLRPDNTNPVSGIDKFNENQMERFLSKSEIDRLWKKLSAEEENGANPYFIAAVRLLILTGARTGEILSLKWEQIDFDLGIARLPDSKTGQKTIQLNETAIEVLESITRIDENPYVIVGSKTGKHMVNIRKAWGNLKNEIGLSDVRLHDFRHTFASIALSNGLSLSEIQHMLGHKTPQTTNRYAHLSAEHLRDTSNKIGDIYKSILK